MTEAQALDYVRAAGAALAVPLDEARAARVAAHLLRTCALAALLEEVPLAEDDEPAEIYSPKAFSSAPGLDSSL